MFTIFIYGHSPYQRIHIFDIDIETVQGFCLKIRVVDPYLNSTVVVGSGFTTESDPVWITKSKIELFFHINLPKLSGYVFRIFFGSESTPPGSATLLMMQKSGPGIRNSACLVYSIWLKSKVKLGIKQSKKENKKGN